MGKNLKKNEKSVYSICIVKKSPPRSLYTQYVCVCSDKSLVSMSSPDVLCN